MMIQPFDAENFTNAFYKKMKKQITYLDYDKVQICTGTILAASINKKPKNLRMF